MFIGAALALVVSLASAQSVSLPYFCGFEDDVENANWVLNPGLSAIVNSSNFVNKWTIGEGAKKSGYNGLYIYTNNDVQKAEYAEAGLFTMAYREFSLPVGNYDLAFNWRCFGERGADEMAVYWVPSNVTLNSSVTTALPSALTSYRLTISDSTALFGSPVWQRGAGTLRVTSSRNYRLVFIWHNNAQVTYNPGACVDNVQINTKKQASDCDQTPANVTATQQDGLVTISWDPVPGATYEMSYWLEGTGITDTIFNIPSSSYALVTDDLNTGLYTFAVRAVCPSGDKSLSNEVSGIKIIGGTIQSMIDACPDLSFLASSVDAEGTKIIVPDCANEFMIKPHIVAGGGSIAGYRVDPIPYNPPFPLNAGTPFQVDGDWADDVWSTPIKLPFGFCFFDGTYNQAQIGANGLITFEAYASGSWCKWNLKNQPNIPNPNFQYLNSIFGVYEDGNAKLFNQSGGGAYYGVMGEYPCRTLTVNWYKEPLYSCTTEYNSYQIVLYETTNVIDVYVNRRYRCDGWNNGIGIIGIINADGSDGLAAPGRNTRDSWEALAPEAWRFTPLSTPVYEMTWYEGKGFDGRVLGTGDSLLLERESHIDTITARLRFSACNGNYFDLADTAVLQWPYVDTLDVLEAHICEGQTYKDAYIETAETGYHEVTLKNQAGCDSLVYRLNLSVYPVDTVILDTTLCYGDTLTRGLMHYYRTGNYVYTHKYQGGCDSLVENIHLTVLPRINYVATSVNATEGPTSGRIDLTTADPTYYYTLNGSLNAPLTGLPVGNYELIVYNSFGCATEPQYLTISTECLEADIVLPLEMICADYPNFIVPFDKRKGSISSYSLHFSALALQNGYKDLDHVPAKMNLEDNGLVDILIPLPSKAKPGTYEAVLTLHDINCGDKDYPFTFTVLYQANIVEQKWNNVLGVLNEKYNGGYHFDAFQWYQNGQPMVGQVGSNLYLGENVIFNAGDAFQIGLVRKGETEEVLSCPFYPIIKQDQLPQAVVKQGTNSWIVECTDLTGADVFVYNSMGLMMASYVMNGSQLEVPMPSSTGLYVLEIVPFDGSAKQVLRVLAQ